MIDGDRVGVGLYSTSDPDAGAAQSLALLDPQTRDGSADHELLDLLGAFEDVVGLSETYPLVPGGAVFVV